MNARACYRYRTLVLVGPWRRRPEKALEDAIGARQVRREDAEGLRWIVEGEIQESPCVDGPCGGVYPPAD